MPDNGEMSIMCHDLQDSWPTDATNEKRAFCWRRKCVDSAASIIVEDGPECVETKEGRENDLSCDEEIQEPDHLAQLPLHSRNEARNLFSTLSREQLVDLLSRACAAHQDVQFTVGKMIEESPSSRRLMIRNIPFTTQNADLLRLLSTKFGHVEDFTIVREKDTQKSKGFGFVTFTNIESVKKALNSNIVLDKRNLIIKLANDQSDICYTTMLANQAAAVQHPQSANSYGQMPSAKEMSEPTARSLSHKSNRELNSPTKNFVGKRKVFVGGLTPTTSSSRLRSSMSVFGCIEECVVINKQKPEGHPDSAGENKIPTSRTFGYVTYSRMNDSLKAVQSKDRIVDGANVFISFANDQPRPSSSRNSTINVDRVNGLSLADHKQSTEDHTIDIAVSHDVSSSLEDHDTSWLGLPRPFSNTDGHFDAPVPFNLPNSSNFRSSSFAVTTSASFLDYPFPQSCDAHHPIRHDERLPNLFLDNRFSEPKYSLPSPRFSLPQDLPRPESHSFYTPHFYP